MSEPRLETIEPFDVAGLTVRTSNEQEMDPETAQVAGVWNQFFEGEVYDNLRDEDEHPPLHGVYSEYESDADGEWTLTVGVAASEIAGHDGDVVMVTVDGGDYLVWEAEGELEEIVPETWEEITDYFAEDAPYVRAFGTDFERFIEGTRLEVYVSVDPA